MELLNVVNLDDAQLPPNPLIPENDWLEDEDVRRDTLYAISSTIVKKYVDLDLSGNGTKNDDSKLEYSRLLLSVGLLYFEFCDGIKEGDGTRVLRCWRYFLLIFKCTGRVNYSIEAFTMLAQYHFLFSRRQAHQLIWGRFINVHGLPARNIPCDLYMEHLNRVCKNAVDGLGANKTPNALTRVGKVVGVLDEVMKKFDEDNNIAERSGKHTVSSYAKDMKTIVGVLLNEHVLQYSQKRYHHSYPNIQRNPISLIDREALLSWMYTQLNKLVHGF